MTARKPRRPDVIEAEARKREAAAKRPMAKVRDDWHQRPRVISVPAVENLLPYDGCICCGALLGAERSLKHRAGCLYLAFTRERLEAERWHGRVLQVEQALREVRNIANGAVARTTRESHAYRVGDRVPKP